MRGILLLSILAVLALTWWYYKLLSRAPQPSPQAVEVLVPTGSSLTQLNRQLWQLGLVRDTAVLRQIAEQLLIKTDSLRGGRFFIEPGSAPRDILRHILYGKQVPVRLVLHDQRELTDLAARAARYLEPDSTAFMQYFLDSNTWQKLELRPESLLSLFIPNTYEIYWNTSPADFVRRMRVEHERFWNSRRRQQAAQLGLRPDEVYTLASIIERETRQDSEKQRMAGVYYNRLQRNMLLQADPTAVFASRDFHTRRVTQRHLRVDSPYNTYRYKGLPPGPITMPSIASIDAVLNLERHDLLFFCARGDGSGLHNFAATLSEHKENAARYRKNKKQKAIK
ncbi:MAG: endolytic transglycosylase MltG [Bacteroidetes bacterium]|nr:MAG: endolytic transglycosylase MltG [Bacteroidota bacterium]